MLKILVFIVLFYPLIVCASLKKGAENLKYGTDYARIFRALKTLKTGDQILSPNEYSIIKEAGSKAEREQNNNFNPRRKIAAQAYEAFLQVEFLQNDPFHDDNIVLRDAAKKGYLEIVKRALENPRVDAGVRNNEAFREACLNNRFEIVQLMMVLYRDRINPSADDSKALIDASKNGNTRIVSLLLNDHGANRVDPNAFSSMAIKKAAENGHTEVVRLLLKAGADPTHNYNYAIRAATKNNHVEVVKLLMTDPRVNPFDLHNDAQNSLKLNPEMQQLFTNYRKPRSEAAPSNVSIERTSKIPYLNNIPRRSDSRNSQSSSTSDKTLYPTNPRSSVGNTVSNNMVYDPYHSVKQYGGNWSPDQPVPIGNPVYASPYQKNQQNGPNYFPNAANYMHSVYAYQNKAPYDPSNTAAYYQPSYTPSYQSNPYYQTTYQTTPQAVQPQTSSKVSPVNPYGQYYSYYPTTSQPQTNGLAGVNRPSLSQGQQEYYKQIANAAMQQRARNANAVYSSQPSPYSNAQQTYYANNYVHSSSPYVNYQQPSAYRPASSVPPHVSSRIRAVPLTDDSDQ